MLRYTTKTMAVVILTVLIGIVRADIIDLGGGQYKAVIQSDTSQTGPNWSMGNE